MLVLFTDFGNQDPYVGQVKGILAQLAPATPVVDLLHAVPDYNAHAGAVLLAALAPAFPVPSVFLCVVDPGVGGPRDALAVRADGRWYVGPDNGLLSIVAGRAGRAEYWRIDWRPASLSASFHGRDLFAPVAARLTHEGSIPEGLTAIEAPVVRFDPGDLPRVVYIDHYGNAWTGLRAGVIGDATLELRGHRLARHRVFQEAGRGEAFWYENSAGLVEIAVNRGSAAQVLGLSVGDTVRVDGHGTRH